jgi:hypothetical protein
VRRRDLWPALGGQVLGGAVLGMPQTATGAKDRASTPATLDTLRTHVRMRANADGRPAYWWYSGVFYGQISGQRTVPLIGIEGISINRCRPAGDGEFTYMLREAGWFTDMTSGAVLDDWLNPLTGRKVSPKHYYSTQQTRFAGATIEPVLATPMPDLEWSGYLGAPQRIADSVWSSEELFVRTVDPATGAGRVQTSLLTLHAAASDLRRSESRFVPATMAYQTLASWRPWMDMRDVPGVISWRLFGRKFVTAAELPPDIAARTRKQHPQLFEA